MAEYSLDLTAAQDSITEYVQSISVQPVIPEGDMSDDSEKIERYPDGSIKPFIILRFYNLRRRPRGRSFGGPRLDQRESSFDIVVVARDGDSAGRLLNRLEDKLIGFKPEGCGSIVDGSAVWEGARGILDGSNKPSRWAKTSRMNYGTQARNVTTP